MRNNFDINIPSVPSKSIKFKIQDIKTTAFGSQKNRFQQNKAFLTKKFIQSFNNFTQKSQHAQEQTQAESKQSNSRIMSGTQQDYRFFIPQEKKYMLYHMDKYKNYKAPILNQTKFDRGYTFYKTDVTLPRDFGRKTREYSVMEQEKSVSDSYFFPSTKQKLQEESKLQTKPTKANSVFKNETRKRAYIHQDKQLNKLGPGQYFKVESERKEQKSKKKKVRGKQDMDYNRLKKIITNIVVNQEEGAIEEQLPDKQKEVKLNYMFRQDDRDRFGQQKYPIVPRLQVPGPGAYQNKNSIQEQSQKVVVVEEQRKLLKQWFNN